jgi:hypothetical protein
VSKVPAVLFPPHHEYKGNLLWNASDGIGRESEISTSLNQLRELGYWASAFPEGDGVTFTEDSGKKRNDELVLDVRACFGWLNISVDLTKLDQEVPKRSPMPSLGYEDPIIIGKAEVALTQLEDSIDLFLAGKHLSSITLAAAADGIFSGLVKQNGEDSVAEEIWESIERARKSTGLDIAGDRARKDAFSGWNWHQNRLKHHDKRDEERLEINIFDHAYYAIKRALADSDKLGLMPKNRIAFEKWVFEHVFT